MTALIKLVINASERHHGELSAEDALGQLLDALTLAKRAAGKSLRNTLHWHLVEIHKNSPLTAMLDPALQQEASVDPETCTHIQQRTDELFAYFQGDIEQTPDWLVAEDIKPPAERLFKRLINGIGRLDVELPQLKKGFSFDKTKAHRALERLAKLAEDDWKAEEWGAIEGIILQAMTHSGKPALKIRERTTNQEVAVIIEDEEQAKIVGEAHRLSEVWLHRPILAIGKIERDQLNHIVRIHAIRIDPSETGEVNLDDIMDENFTGDLTVEEFLRRMWGG